MTAAARFGIRLAQITSFWAVLALVMTVGHAMATDVKLTVNNPGQAKYASFPVTSGVPLAQDMRVTDLSRLSLIDSRGKAIPAQFRVLARWGNLDDASAPIRWVLVDFQTDLEPRGKGIFTLRTNAGGSEIPGQLVQDGPQSLEVNTGGFSFKVSKKGFRLLEDVRTGTLSVPGAQIGGLEIIRKGKHYLSALGESEAVVEENGALRAVIRVRGDFKDAEGNVFVGGDARPKPMHPNGGPGSENLPLNYTVRITIFKGQSFVKVETTFENTANSLHTFFPVNDVFVDGLNAIQPLPSGEFSVQFSGNNKPVKSGSILQLHKLVDATDESKNFYSIETLAGKTTERQGRYPGWAVASVTNGEVMAFVKDFWERYPKSLEVTDKALVVGLLPDNPAIPDETCEYLTHNATGRHYFSGSWHMTDSIWFNFQKAASKSNPDNQAACFSAPLFALCDPNWFAQSEAWGKVGPAGFHSKDPTIAKALSIYEAMVAMPVDKTKSKTKLDLDAMREKRTMNKTWFGWENYGDWVHGWRMFASLIYDWPYIMWLQYARSGDERFRKKALEMTHHSSDMDLLHGGRSDGTWQWEKQGPDFLGFHHKAPQGAGAMLSHTWNGGYVLGYLLTGDQRWLESAQSTVRAAQRVFRKVIDGDVLKMNQTRHQGWSILVLVNYYKITGDKALLEQAMRIFTGSLLYTEQLAEMPGSGGKGYITETGSYNGQYKGEAVATFQTYPLEPLCELHVEASRAGLDVASLESYILRCLNFLSETAIVGGVSQGGKYSVLSISYATNPDNPESNKGGQLHHNVLMVGPFAYAAENLLKNDPQRAKKYIELARRLFRDVMFYGPAQKLSKIDFLDPAKIYEPQWPYQPVVPKVMGWIGRGAQFYLNYEYKHSNSH